MRFVATGVVLGVLLASPLLAQQLATVRERASAAEDDRTGWARVPFAVGERLDYDVRFGRVQVGSGWMEVAGVKGIFSENGRAEIWLSDDDRRIMLQMKSKLSFGSLNLYLRSIRTIDAAGSDSRP